MAGRAARRQLASALVWALAVLVAASAQARAGAGVQPDAATITVETDASGYIVSPRSLELVVSLDPGDAGATVWVSTSPGRSVSGAPTGSPVGSCDAASLRPLAARGDFVCDVSTILMRPGLTYYWWLVYTPSGAAGAGGEQVSGPFSFALAVRTASAPQTSTRTLESAPLLPSRARFAGRRSVKDTTLGTIVTRTMQAAGRPPRALAVACWTRADFTSVLASVGQAASTLRTETMGFWYPSQPHWLHLSQETCTRAQRLLDTRTPTGRNASGLAITLHETMHAYGIANEAEANCLAAQLTPLAARIAGFSPARARYLGTLARNYLRVHAAAHYWDARRCRDGGAWDVTSSERQTRWPAPTPRVSG